MDVTLPSSMQRFMIRVGLGKKSKLQRQSSRSPSSGCLKSRPISAAAAKESVKSARDEGTVARRSTSKSVASESDPSSLGAGARATVPNSSSTVLSGKNLAQTPESKRAETFLGTLTNKLRVRTPAPTHTPVATFDEPGRTEVQSSIHSRTFRPQAVPIDLPNDIASRERRAEALRARGLLPPKPQALSAIEAEEDRRIDADRVHGLSFPGSAHSEAIEIAQSWRSNSMGLCLGPTTADAPVKLGPEVSISPINVSGDGLDTEEADLPTSEPRDGPSFVPKPLPSDAHHSPVPSRPASLRSSSSGGLTGLVQSVAPPERSFLQQSHITEESQGLLPTSSIQRPPSPSRGIEDVPAPHSPRLSPSSHSPQPATSSHLPIPQQISVPDASLPCLPPSELDTLPASPTSPTEPSLFFSSSSESHSTVFTDNGETPASPVPNTMLAKGRRANVSPIRIKGCEGGLLCKDTIFETTESFPEDDLNPFSGRTSTAPVDLEADVPAANPPRRKSLAFLRMSKKRTSTLGPFPTAGISKPASTGNLRRTMMTALQTRARGRRSTLSSQDRSRPLSPANVTMHTDASIIAQVSMIDDEESRRLSELAFA